ncbi:MAG: hypothetical protein ACR2MT_02775 [Aurantibacter sp.]
MEDYVEHKVKTKVEKYITIAFKIFFGILAGIAFALLFGYIIMWLWNWLMPAIFGLTVITYWQAVGILVLGKLIFGGLGSGHHSKSHKEKPRKRFREKMRESCKSDFSRWEHYDKFWEEEGEKAYRDYVQRSHEEEQ